MRYLSLSLALVLLCSGSVWAYQGENFFIINWDGMRYDALRDSLPKFLLNELKPEGILFEHLYNAWHTWTSAGHPNIHTGNPNYFPNVGDYQLELDHYLPSLLETYVKEKGNGPADSVKAFFIGDSENDRAWGYSSHPSYPDQSDETAIHAARSIRPRVGDTVLWEKVMRPTLDSLEPDLVYVDFHDIDTRGHHLDPEHWDSTLADYHRAITIADSLTYHIIHEYIPSRDKYRDKTNVLIISDHGRHLDAVGTGLKDHGCDCIGCRRVMGLLWGPDFKPGLVVQEETFQTEFAHTIVHLLGLLAPHARTSRVRTEWLKNPEPETGFHPLITQQPLARDSVTCSFPDVAVSGDGRVHVVWCENDRVIKYRHKEDHIWSEADSFAACPGQLVKTPKIAVMGDAVAICWERYRTRYPMFRSWYLDLVYSEDGGRSWSPIDNGVFDKAVLNADLVMGEDMDGSYILVATSHTLDRGAMYIPLRTVTVKKGRPGGEWELKLEANTHSSIQNIDLAGRGRDLTLTIESVVFRYKNFEISKSISSDHGETWTEPALVTCDPEGGYRSHDYSRTSVRLKSAVQEEIRRAAEPTGFALLQSHPNPFNPITVISYNLPLAGHVRLELFNLSGQRVATLVSQHQEAGQHSVTWDAREYSSGVYFSKLTAGEQTVKRRMLLLR